MLPVVVRDVVQARHRSGVFQRDGEFTRAISPSTTIDFSLEKPKAGLFSAISISAASSAVRPAAPAFRKS